MKVKKAFIKSRRTETHITSEAYQYGGDDHGDAIGLQVSIPLEGLVLCFPDGEGGIEMIEIEELA